MQYELILTGKFKKSLKLARKRGLDISEVLYYCYNISIALHRDHKMSPSIPHLTVSFYFIP